MKKGIIALAALLFTVHIQAQVSTAGDVSVSMSQGVQQGFKILIPETNAKDAARSWEKLIKEYGAKTSKVPKSDDFISDQVVVPSIEDKAITIYANFNETPEGVYLNAFFKRGDTYLNSSNFPQKAIAARGLMRKFAIATALEAVNKKVDTESKSLDKLEREQKGLEKDKEGYEKDIKKAKEVIETREAALEKNDQEQIAKKREIAEQKKKLDAVKREASKYK
ncbi:MAG: hypothetical protein JJ975_15285 [Bacteroidia bacterium]|nr:hypothetical protein [Bacteroidia bacterium]